MKTRRINRVIAHVRHIALAQEGASLTDAELLECFTAKQEEAAFEAILRRHGSMVFGVCRRVLRDTHHAEDAFQATFLVLARKASSIRSRELLANWLYGVAYQTALKARIAAVKRRAKERSMNEIPEPAGKASPAATDWQDILDQELHSLPDRYRIPILLCDLEGKSRKEAADQLGVPEGTLNSRLARARTYLAKRLNRHGVVFSGGAIAAMLTHQTASACVPAPLIGSTLKIATAIATGHAATTLVSAKVAALTEGVLKAMMMSKLKAVVTVVLLFGFMGAGAIVLTNQLASGSAGQPAIEFPAKPDQKKAPSPKEEVFTAWGKEVNGLQAGLGFRPGEKRAYRHGETVKLVVRVRNVAKEPVKFEYLREFFMETPPTAMDSQGKPVLSGRGNVSGLIHLPVEVTVAVGKEIELYELKAELKPASDNARNSTSALHGTGTFQLQYDPVFGSSSAGGIKVDPTLSKLATGKLELEVREPEKLPQKKEEKESFTAWGKEINGLQAGLGFRAGEKRAYSHGEEAWIVLRLRNIGKGASAQVVEFNHIWAFFVENPPTITDADGKILRLPKLHAEGKQMPRNTHIGPGREVVLYEWNCALLPIGGVSKNLFAIHGSGKFSFQCERIVGPTSGNPNHPNLKFDKLATGKLEMQVNAPKKAPAKAGEEGGKLAAPEELQDDSPRVRGMVTDEDRKPLAGVAIEIVRTAYAKDAKEPRIEVYGMTRTGADGKFEIADLKQIWKIEPRSGYSLKLSSPGFAPKSLAVDKGFDSKKEIKVILKKAGQGTDDPLGGVGQPPSGGGPPLPPAGGGGPPLGSGSPPPPAGGGPPAGRADKDARKPKDDESAAWDLTPPKKEPKYKNEPRYALLVFGPKREQRVWLVLDGTTLYVDRNGNGDLTEPGNRLEPNNPKDGSNRFAGPSSHTHYDVFEFTVQAGSTGKSKFQLNHWIRTENFVPQTDFDKDLHARWLKLRWENTTLFRLEGLGQAQTPVLFMPRPADAQVCALDGPLTFVVRAPEYQSLRRGTNSDLSFCIAVPGRPPRGTQRQFCNPLSTKEVPKDAHLEVDIEYPAKAAKDPPLRRKYTLKQRC